MQRKRVKQVKHTQLSPRVSFTKCFIRKKSLKRICLGALINKELIRNYNFEQNKINKTKQDNFGHWSTSGYQLSCVSPPHGSNASHSLQKKQKKNPRTSSYFLSTHCTCTACLCCLAATCRDQSYRVLLSCASHFSTPEYSVAAALHVALDITSKGKCCMSVASTLRSNIREAG